MKAPKKEAKEVRQVIQEVVVSDDVGPISKYKPYKSTTGINPHVWRHAKILGMFMAVFVPLCLLGLYLSTHLDPLDPKMNQVRFAVILTTSTIMKFLGLSGFVVFLEIVTNGNLIGQAISTSYGAAGFGAFVIVAAALILM